MHLTEQCDEGNGAAADRVLACAEGGHGPQTRQGQGLHHTRARPHAADTEAGGQPREGGGGAKLDTCRTTQEEAFVGTQLVEGVDKDNTRV